MSVSKAIKGKSKQKLGRQRVIATALEIVLDYRSSLPTMFWADFDQTLNMLQYFSGKAKPYAVRGASCEEKAK